MSRARRKSTRGPTRPLAACPVDPVLLGIVSLLLMFGFVMIGSASIDISARNFGDPFHLITRHSVYLFLALGAAVAVLGVPVRIWQRLDVAFLGLAVMMLVAVLIPGIGREVNGATRWISLGLFSIQGSEYVKLFLVFYIAGYLVRRKEQVETSVTGFAKPLVVLALIAALLLAQPDYGTSVVVASVVIGMIFLAGAPWRFFLPALVLSVSMAALLAFTQPYRVARLTAFVNPWADPENSGYQLVQALIAFGRGEWFGLGLGNSIQKLFFLPEAHTDFLFSIVAEELGVVGGGIVILLFAWLVLRGLAIGLEAKNRDLPFHCYLAYGIALLLGVQALVNLGVNLGVLPTKGLTLPFLGYGGNSLIISSVMVALLLRVEFEAREAGGLTGVGR